MILQSSGPDVITSLHTRMQEELVRGQGKVRMEETETAVMGPQAKECQQHSEAEREKEEIPLKVSWRNQPANTLILALSDSFQTFGFQNCKTSETLSLWEFVTVATGN